MPGILTSSNAQTRRPAASSSNSLCGPVLSVLATAAGAVRVGGGGGAGPVPSSAPGSTVLITSLPLPTEPAGCSSGSKRAACAAAVAPTSTISTICTAMGPARTAPGAGAEYRGLVWMSAGKVVCGSASSDRVKSLASSRNRSDRSRDASFAVLLGGTSVATYSGDGDTGMSVPSWPRSRSSSGAGTGVAEVPGPRRPGPGLGPGGRDM